MANKTSSKGGDGFINKAKKPLAFFRRFESIVQRGSSGKAIAGQAKDDPTTNLCELCSDLEKFFFCAPGDWVLPIHPYDEFTIRRALPHHKCLSDLLKSASDGCGLCKVFRHCFLYKHFLDRPYNSPDFENLQAVQDFLLAGEPRKDLYHVNEHPRWRQENGYTDKITRKRWYEFDVEMYREKFHKHGIGHKEQDHSGFVTLQLVWEGSSIKFLITSEPGSAAHLEGDFIGRAISMYPDFHFVEDLLRECRLSHDCTLSQAREPRQMPTRLISIRDEGLESDPSLNLVEWSEAAEAQPYIALSHRWAKAVDCVTLLGNIEERMTNLDYNILPQTFKDAIIVSLVHGYTYLWIDCLCIVQDDSQDWERECPKMVEVYSNADLTIAAVTATDSYAGFLGARNNLHSSNTFMLRYWNSQNLHQGWLEIQYLNDLTNPLMPNSGTPLDARGWTLQERLFSNRILSFSKDQVYWECNESFRTESLHFACTSSSHGTGRTGKRDLKALKAMEKSNLYQWWYKILMDYCSRKLTFSMDNLPAISGIAAMFQKLTNDVYLAGLWQNDISCGLAWQPLNKEHRTGDLYDDINLQYRAPSWSWARFDCSEMGASHCLFTGPVHGFVEFISADIKLRGEDPYGQVEEGTRLNIRAPTKQGFISNRANQTVDDDDYAKVVIKLPYHTTYLTTLRVTIDASKFLHEILDGSIKTTEDWSEEYEGLQVTTIHLCRYEDHPPKFAKYSYLTSSSFGLVLMRVGNGNTFRRIGLLDTSFSTEWKSWTPIDDWFADAEIKELTLI